jgi:two-component system response regulator WspF
VRIALVNDLRIALEALRRVVRSVPDTEIAWTAANGEEALDRCRADRPDLILMDMIMPVIDGVEATGRIMQECPCPIVVVTATVSGNAGLVYEALGHGALDAVNTPVLGPDGGMAGAEGLIRKIRTVQRLTGGPATAAPTTMPTSPAPAPPARPATDAARLDLPALVAIGASTGGPQALVEVLSGMAPAPSRAVVIVQHVDRQFATGLAEWLEQATGWPVHTADAGGAVEPGTAAVACTDDHLVLDGAGRFRYVREPAEEPYRPSVDVFFDSLLRARVAPGAAVLLTGMGRDGATGLLAMREAGWHTIAQDQASSVVWGMPGAAVGLNAAVQTLPPDEIGAAVERGLARLHRPGAREPS